MSLTIALIPLALAVAAHRAAKKDAVVAGHRVFEIQTRMRDRDLLAAALNDLGRTADLSGADVAVSYRGDSMSFSYDADGILQAHFEGEVDVDAAEAFLADLDEQYAHRVQEQVYKRLLERATTQGLAVESEYVDADNSIVVTLRVS